MLQQAMRALGFDFDREVAKLIARGRDQIAAVGARTVFDMKAAMREVAQSAILLTAGIVFAAAAVGLASAALFLVVDQRYGTFAALGAIGGIAAVLAGGLLYAACQRAPRTGEAPLEEVVAPAAIEEPYIEPPPVRPSAYLSTLIPPPPPGAPLTEILLHQAKTRGAEAADEAIGQAEQVIRAGSRPALVTTLALTALVGLYFGRQKRF